MAISLLHSTQATGTDAGNGEIQKAEWNDQHSITMATDRLLGRVTAGGGAVEELTATQVRTFLNVADGATANSSDATLLARANHTGTQTASTISDFDTEVSNNTTVAANTAARHAALTVTDSSEINFTLTGQDLTAALVAGSIDETKLDTSVNASLDLADSATQPGDLATVATTGDYDDLANKPTIPSATRDINEQTGSTYTLVLADNGKLLVGNSGSAQTFTIPPNSSVAFDVGTQIDLLQAGAGAVSLSEGSGVTLNGATELGGQYAGGTLIKQATDTWVFLSGEPGGYLDEDDIGVLVQGYDAETLKADADDNLTAGYTSTADNDGTQSSGTYTPTPAGGNLKRIVNGGAFTFAAPSASGDYTLIMQVTNNASAGTITFSGFSMTGGDDFTTTDGDDFLVYIVKINGFTHATVAALQ